MVGTDKPYPVTAVLAHKELPFLGSREVESQPMELRKVPKPSTPQ